MSEAVSVQNSLLSSAMPVLGNFAPADSLDSGGSFASFLGAVMSGTALAEPDGTAVPVMVGSVSDVTAAESSEINPVQSIDSVGAASLSISDILRGIIAAQSRKGFLKEYASLTDTAEGVLPADVFPGDTALPAAKAAEQLNEMTPNVQEDASAQALPYDNGLEELLISLYPDSTPKTDTLFTPAGAAAFIASLETLAEKGKLSSEEAADLFEGVSDEEKSAYSRLLYAVAERISAENTDSLTEEISPKEMAGEVIRRAVGLSQKSRSGKDGKDSKDKRIPDSIDIIPFEESVIEPVIRVADETAETHQDNVLPVSEAAEESKAAPIIAEYDFDTEQLAELADFFTALSGELKAQVVDSETSYERLLPSDNVGREAIKYRLAADTDKFPRIFGSGGMTMDTVTDTQDSTFTPSSTFTQENAFTTGSTFIDAVLSAADTVGREISVPSENAALADNISDVTPFGAVGREQTAMDMNTDRADREGLPVLSTVSGTAKAEDIPARSAAVTDQQGSTDGDEVKIPVSEAYVPAAQNIPDENVYENILEPVSPTDSFAMAERIADRISFIEDIQADSSHITMKLEPEELGEIKVTVRRTHEGTVIDFTAQKSEAAAIIGDKAENLAEALAAKGIRVKEISVAESMTASESHDNGLEYMDMGKGAYHEQSDARQGEKHFRFDSISDEDTSANDVSVNNTEKYYREARLWVSA